MGLGAKNILVTGGTGFIGSHLVEALIAQGSYVIVPYQSLNPYSYFSTSNLHNKSTLVFADLKDYRRILDVISKYEIDLVFHLGAQAIVPTAYINPLGTIETNIIGTANVLEASRFCERVKGIVVITSDKVYGKLARASENNSVGGDHPYEVSKAAADILSRMYFVTYKLPVVTLRFGNVYGEGDLNFSRIIPAIMESILKKQQLQIRSNGKFVRDYVYVGDIVEGMILCAKNISKISGEVFNLSSFENLSVGEVVKSFEASLNKKVDFRINNIAVNEIPTQSLNFSKIKKRLGWSPKNNIGKTSEKIFDWYQQYFNSLI